MARPQRLLLAVSGHGYGHLAQCAPVINALWERHPDLQLTVLSTLPQAVLAGRLDQAFRHIETQADPVLQMHSAWEVDVGASCRTYGEFHRRHAAHLARACEQLHTLSPDLVLANIPWVVLEAARQLEIPAVALGSLNWATIYAAYCGSRPGSNAVLAGMWSGYRAALQFIAPAPALPMPELTSVRRVGPIARSGTPCRAVLCEALALPAAMRTVLVALGGIESPLPLAHWPRIEGVVWLFPMALETVREDLFPVAALPMGFVDLLASVDAVLTKPGYGTYAEAVCNGVALLSLQRPDWPETEHLTAWARRHGRLREIGPGQFASGRFVQTLHDLWQQPPPPPPAATGAREAADLLAVMLAT